MVEVLHNEDRFAWGDDSLVAQVSIRTDHKYPTAFLHGSEHATAQELHAIQEKLIERGLRCFADIKDGEPVLRVWGFGQTERLLSELKESGAVSGKRTQTAKAEQQKHTITQTIKDHSVVAAGLTYLVGDALVVSSGVLRKDSKQIMGGAQWGSTSVLLALFGTKDPVDQMQRLYREMDDYLERSDVELSKSDVRVLNTLRAGGDGFWSDIKNVISDHLIFINNAVFGLGGINMTKAGLFQDKNLLKAASGAAVTGGMWGSLLIPEDAEAGMSRAEVTAKKQAEKDGKSFEEKPVDPFEQPWTWLKRKPLRLAGLGAGLNNVLMGTSGWIYEFPKQLQKVKTATVGTLEHTKAQANMRGAICDGMTPAAYIVANTFYGMSPKDRAGMLKEDGYLEELYSVAAHIFSELPEEERTTRTAQFAGFMSTRPAMKSSAEEILEKLEARMDALEHNPWTGKQQQPDTHAHEVQHLAALKERTPQEIGA